MLSLYLFIPGAYVVIEEYDHVVLAWLKSRTEMDQHEHAMGVLDKAMYMLTQAMSFPCAPCMCDVCVCVCVCV
jgi:hypothetical protein